jgi:L-aspartate oxidase
LLEAVVFGGRAAQDINGMPALSTPNVEDIEAPLMPDVAPSPTLRRLMTANVGVVRTGAGLSRALSSIGEMERNADSLPAKNIAATALMIAAAAFQRHESRGAHFRQDMPTSDPTQAHRSMLTLERARAIADEAAAARPLPAHAQ